MKRPGKGSDFAGRCMKIQLPIDLAKLPGVPSARPDDPGSNWKDKYFQMKFRQLLLPALVFACIFAMSSCVKNYTCHCDIKYSGYPGLPDSSNQEFSISDTKSSAKSKCQNQSGTFDNNGIHTVETCYLY